MRSFLPTVAALSPRLRVFSADKDFPASYHFTRRDILPLTVGSPLLEKLELPRLDNDASADVNSCAFRNLARLQHLHTLSIGEVENASFQELHCLRTAPCLRELRLGNVTDDLEIDEDPLTICPPTLTKLELYGDFGLCTDAGLAALLP